MDCLSCFVLRFKNSSAESVSNVGFLLGCLGLVFEARNSVTYESCFCLIVSGAPAQADSGVWLRSGRLGVRLVIGSEGFRSESL